MSAPIPTPVPVLTPTPVPVLYSFRRCPYAMRARMAIAYSQLTVEIREVVLKDKPDEMLSVSPKGTVPVLIIDKEFNEQQVLEESLDIMHWALSQNDPDNIKLEDVDHYLNNEFIFENDNDFKTHLDHYKYADRFPVINKQQDEQYYREQGEVFLDKLNNTLSKNKYLTGHKLSVVDLAVFPFIRQFAFVDKAWFDQSRYVYLINWLDEFLSSELFLSIMSKLPQWHAGDKITLFSPSGNK